MAEAADGMEAIRLCRSGNFDIVIMDIMMRRLTPPAAKCAKPRIPIIMLSARGEEYDKINGFDRIDDYVKPFPKELM